MRACRAAPVRHEPRVGPYRCAAYMLAHKHQVLASHGAQAGKLRHVQRPSHKDAMKLHTNMPTSTHAHTHTCIQPPNTP